MRRMIGIWVALLLMAAMVVPVSAAQRKVELAQSSLEATEHQRVNDLAAAEYASAGAEGVERLMARLGYRLVSGTDVPVRDGGGDVQAESNGSAIPSIRVQLWQETQAPYHYTAGISWNWNDYQWDWDGGPEDVVSVNFETADGAPLNGTIIDGQTVQKLFLKGGGGGIPCGYGSLWKIDNALKGLIFKYQDVTRFMRSDMCGDQVWTQVWIDKFGDSRPVVTHVRLEHNYSTGTLKDATLELDSTGKVKLSVTYSKATQSWPKEAQLVTYAP